MSTKYRDKLRAMQNKDKWHPPMALPKDKPAPKVNAVGGKARRKQIDRYLDSTINGTKRK